MTEFIKIITHARRLKSALKPVAVEELKEIRRKLDDIIESREKELEKERAEILDKEKKIAKYKKMMESEGIFLDDFRSLSKKKKAKKSTREPKYEIVVDGERITWTGQGRMPRVLRERIDAGASKDDFLIKKK